MSSVGLYGFDIPHEFVTPTRDMCIIRIPFPPQKVGNLLIPDLTRELMAHNVLTGRIVAVGPLAFTYKSGEDNKLSRQDVKLGDWVLIRPYAGTMVQGGQLMITSGYRYVSSFSDVIGIVPADKMPDPATLLWDVANVHDVPPAPKVAAKQEFAFDNKKAV